MMIFYSMIIVEMAAFIIMAALAVMGVFVSAVLFYVLFGSVLGWIVFVAIIFQAKEASTCFKDEYKLAREYKKAQTTLDC